MITWEVESKTGFKVVKALHKQDLPKDAVIHTNPYPVSRKHIGHYFKFDDGSNLYSKIIYASYTSIMTDIGIVRKKDIVHVARPKPPHTAYSGVPTSDESLYVRNPAKYELKIAKDIIEGSPPAHATNRIKVMTLDMLAKEASEIEVPGQIEKGVTAKMIIQRLTELALVEKTNQHSFKALASLAWISGAHIEEPRRISEPATRQPLFGQAVDYEEITDEPDSRVRQLESKLPLKEIQQKLTPTQSRTQIPLPTVKEINKIVTVVKNEKVKSDL